MNETTRRDDSQPARETLRVRTQRAILAERLEAERARADDLWVRALISETPLADRAYRLAERDCRRLEAEVTSLDRRLRLLAAGRASATLPRIRTW